MLISSGRELGKWIRVVIIVPVFLATIEGAPAATNILKVWGTNAVLNNVPADATNVSSLWLDSNFAVAVLQNGKARAWGTVNTNVPANATNLTTVAFSASPYYGGGLALRADTSVIDWNGALKGTNAVDVAIQQGACTSCSSVILYTNGTAGGYTDVAGIGNNSGVRLIYIDGSVSSSGGLSSSDMLPLTNVVAETEGPGVMEAWLKADGTMSFQVSATVTNTPEGLSNVVAIAAGTSHLVALRRDGLLVAWGDNSYGQTNVPANLTNVAAISAGANHTLALTRDGKIFAWGRNDLGQTDIPIGITNAAAIFAKGNMSAAIVGDLSPTLLSQPPDESVWTGRRAEFIVKAIGSPGLQYQWQFNGTNIQNATNFFYRMEAVSSTNAGAYKVVVTNPVGSVTSRTVQLTVRSGPPVLTKNLVNSTVWEGDALTLSMKTDGSFPMTNRWLYNGSVIPGMTENFLSFTNIALGQTGNYWIVSSNAYGAATGDVFTVTVTDRRPSFSVQPTNENCWWGTAAYFSTTPAGYPSMVRQWCFNGQPLSPSPQTDYLYLQNLTSAQAGDYTLVLSNAWGMATSSVAKLTVLLTTGTITAWGDSPNGQNNVPPGLTNVSAIAAGGFFSMALRPDGTVAAWGANDAGQTNVPAGLVGVTAIAGGFQHALALRSNGTVVAWGYNYYGQTNVPIGLTNVVGISAGDGHSVALRADGTVVAWGDNHANQTNTPVGLSNVVAISAGESHTLALKADGTVVAWGTNYNGETTVPAGLSNIVAVAAGQFNSIALRPNGQVVAWGTSLPTGLTNLAIINGTGSSGASYIGVRTDGTVAQWSGGSSITMLNPPPLSNVVAVAVGVTHSLALVQTNLAIPVIATTNGIYSNHVFSLSAPTIRGRSYYLQYCDLLAASWTSLTPLPGDGGVKIFMNTNLNGNQRFYRLWQQP